MSFKMCLHTTFSRAGTYQEGAEHVEADEVEDGEAASTGVVILEKWGTFRIPVTHLVGKTSQHYLLPCFTGSTSARIMPSTNEVKTEPRTQILSNCAVVYNNVLQ